MNQLHRGRQAASGDRDLMRAVATTIRVLGELTCAEHDRVRLCRHDFQRLQARALV